MQLLLLFPLFLFNLTAGQLTASTARVNLDAGDILGVTISNETNTFYVQQAILSTEKIDGAVIIRSHREISSWHLDTQSIRIKRSFEQTPSGSTIYPCGHVDVSSKLHRVAICSAATYLEILDSASLNTVGKIASAVPETIYDFVIDEAHDRVFVLSVRGRSSWLTMYSMLDGTQQQEVSVSAPGKVVGLGLALEPALGQIGIAITRANRSGDYTEIYLCRSDAGLACTSAGEVDPVAQMSFLGRQLLYATLTFADRKRECIMNIDPSTHLVSRKYCAPATGVHYAMGVMEGKYIVGYTGLSKRGWFSEETSAVKNAFSIWRAESHRVDAVVEDPTSHGAFQNEISVVASRTAPIFIAYQRLSNMLCIYSIVDRN